jgi:hypothetical protein
MKPRNMIPVLVCSLVLAYPLSAGLYSRAYFLKDPPPPPALRAFYAPLFELCERFHPMQNAMNWYLALWEEKHPPSVEQSPLISN